MMATPRYVGWVSRIRELQAQGRSLILAIYDEICIGRDTLLWSEGPYQSFERFLDQELGIHPQRWAHIESSIKRFGRDWVGKYGHEIATLMLRLPPDSEQEKTAFELIQKMEDVRGRPPSDESVARVVSKLVPPARPVRAKMSEEERLRKVVHDLQRQLKEARKQLLVEQRARSSAEAKVLRLRQQLAKKRAPK